MSRQLSCLRPSSDHELFPDIKGGKGDAHSLFISSSMPKPLVGPGHAIVKIKAFGLNRMDLIQREGNYPVPAGASKVLGVEFSGTITGMFSFFASKSSFRTDVFAKNLLRSLAKRASK